MAKHRPCFEGKKREREKKFSLGKNMLKKINPECFTTLLCNSHWWVLGEKKSHISHNPMSEPAL